MAFGINRAIVELCTSGHHPVYLKHILEYFRSNILLKDKFFFILNEHYRDMFNYCISSIDAEFIFLNQIEIDNLYTGNLLVKSVKLTRFVNNICKKHNVTEVILMDMNVFQFGLMFTRRIDYKGIVFSQYFRQNKSKSLNEKIRFYKRALLIKLLVKKSNIKNIFFINDVKGVASENIKLKSDKLKSINDPVDPFDHNNIIDIRQRYNIPKSHKVFLHYGSFDERKGSELILDSLLEINKLFFKDITLIYAGMTKKMSLANKLDKKILKLANKGLNTIFINSYIDKIMTESLFVSADYVLCPYTSVEASSGNVGLAIASDTLIVGPSEGLLGSIILESGLGITIDNINQKSLKYTLEYLFTNELESRNSIINIESRSPIKFAEDILS